MVRLRQSAPSPREGGLGRGLLGRTANSGAGCFLRVGMAAIRHALSLNFPLPVRVCPLPTPLPRKRGWVQAALKVSGNLSNGFCSGLKNEKTVRRHAHRFAESKIQTDGSLHLENKGAGCFLPCPALTPHFQSGFGRYRVAFLPQHGNQPLAAHQVRRAHGKQSRLLRHFLLHFRQPVFVPRNQ